MAAKKAAAKPKAKAKPKAAKKGKGASTAIGKAIDKGIAAGEINADHLVSYAKLRDMKF